MSQQDAKQAEDAQTLEERKKEEEKGLFRTVVPDGESILIDFDKHENDNCLLLRAERVVANGPAILTIKYKFLPDNFNELPEEEQNKVELVDKEDKVKFEKDEKVKELQYTFLNDCDAILEANGSEIAIDGMFVPDPEEEDPYEYTEEEEEEEKKE